MKTHGSVDNWQNKLKGYIGFLQNNNAQTVSAMNETLGLLSYESAKGFMIEGIPLREASVFKLMTALFALTFNPPIPVPGTKSDLQDSLVHKALITEIKLTLQHYAQAKPNGSVHGFFDGCKPQTDHGCTKMVLVDPDPDLFNQPYEAYRTSEKK